MKRISLADLPGLLLIALGFSNILGWYAHVPLLITQFPNNVGMVINTGVCFVVAGMGLYLSEQFPQHKRNIYHFAGLFLSLSALLILSEYLFDYSSGIDSLLITPWVGNASLYAGRVSSLVAATFLLAAVIFLLEPYTHRKSVAILAQILMFCVTCVGASTLAGIVFKINLLSSWYGYTSMNVFAASGFIILGIGFLSAWTKSSYYHQFYKGNDDKKIILSSAIILFAAVFISNVMSFVSYARNYEVALRNIMTHSLTRNTDLDMSAFYQPLRSELAFGIPVLLITIGLGCLFLYLQVAPLVRRIVRLKNKALASKIRLRAIMDHVGEAIVTIDANGIIETVNQAALTIFVCEADDMIGKKLAKFVPALGDTSSSGNNVLCLGENVTEETQGSRLNNVFFPLELVMTRMHLRKQKLYVCIMRDITLRREVDAKLQDSEARFHTAFDIAPIGMSLVSLDGNIMQMNPALCKIFGYKQHEVTQLNLKTITHPDDLELTFANIKQVLDGVVQSVKFEKRYYHKSGRLIWALVNVSVIRGVAAEPRYLIAQIQDITEQKESEEQLHYRAHFDPLTGLANRSMLEESLGKIIASAERNEKKFAVFYLDLDRFKEVNDTLGHDAGDRLLKIVAERLKVDTRKNDIIARMGGDEFVLVLTELSDYKTAASFAERIIASLLQPITIQRHELFMTASIGISFYPSDGLDSDKLLKNADNALYRAKESGKNNYQFCASEVSKKIKDKMLFERDMQQALAREEFKIYYLPIISTANKCVSSVEALLRWQSGQFGLISPQQIIPVAEETGLILPLSEWVIKTACNQLLAIQKSSASAINLSVNISARHFMQYHLIESIIKVLQESGFDSSSFMLEINENLIMQDPTLSMDVMRKLKQYGIGVVVDNFGTGFSSLRQLQQYDTDFIKIDRSLVQNIFSGSQQLELAKAIITLAKNLGIKVIAEGVESREQYDFMVEHGCDEIQGYYISKPMLGSDLKRFLEKSRMGVDLMTV